MRRLWWKLLLLFTVVPTVELYVLIQIGTHLGPLTTVAIILLTGTLGAWLAKREGTAVIKQVSADLSRGLPPASRLVEGLLVLVGAVLLVTPGVVTDVTGFVLILPLTRRLVAPVALRWLLRRFNLEALADVTLGEPEPMGAPAPEPVAAEPVEHSPFSHPTR